MKELPPIDLDGFAPNWGAGEYTWGAPVAYPSNSPLQGQWKDHQYHVEVLGWYYHDYLGTHIFAQVWDYAQQDDPDQRWQYVLLLHRPTRYLNRQTGVIESSEWAWSIRKEYEVEKFGRPPSYAEVGADVDTWVTSPDYLRPLLQ